MSTSENATSAGANAKMGKMLVSVPIHLEYRDPVAALIRAVCERLERQGKARAGTANQVVSAFNEAFNNLAIHGVDTASDAVRCQMEVELSPEQLILRFMDPGPGFDPEASRADPVVGEPGEGGYGLYIMRAYMNEVKYTRGVDGQPNLLCMVRNLGDHEGAE